MKNDTLRENLVELEMIIGLRLATVLRSATCLVAIAAAQPALADVKAGVDAWQRGDYETAITEWREPAISGDADAQFNMGQAYKFGRGVEMNLDTAADWFKKAADQGHLRAADNYGLILFQSGKRQESVDWLKTSAARGEPRAQYILGTAHFNGELVEKDWVRAYALMTRASAAGLPQASENLAAMERYVSASQREQGIRLAGQLRQDADRERQRQLAGLTLPPTASGNLPARSSASTKPLQQASLPPSRPAAPAPVITTPAPTSNAAVTTAGATSAGADFARPDTSPTVPTFTSTPTARKNVTVSTPPQSSSNSPWRLQLGAFGSQDKAAAVWNSLEQRNSALQNLQPYLVDAGKVVRLQVGGFANRADADKLCSALKQVGQDCFAVKR